MFAFSFAKDYRQLLQFFDILPYLWTLDMIPWQRALNTWPSPKLPILILLTVALISGKCLSPKSVGCIFKSVVAFSLLLSASTVSHILAEKSMNY